MKTLLYIIWILSGVAQAGIVSFNFRMVRIESGIETPIDLDAGKFQAYTFTKRTLDGWQPTVNIHIIPSQNENFALRGRFEGEPGLYRIFKKPTAISPYGCDLELDIGPEMNGKIISIPNRVVDVKRGSIHVVTSKGVPHKNVKIRSVHPNVGFLQKVGVSHAPNNEAFTDDHGVLQFNFIEDDSPYIFRIRNERIHDNFSPIFREFAAETLSKGEVWRLEEVPVQAVFDIYLRKGGALKKISVSEAESLFGDILLPVYVQDPVTKTYRLGPNASHYSEELGGLVFRGALPVDRKLYLGKNIETSKGNFVLDNQKSGHFQIGTDDVFKGAMYILGPVSGKVPFTYVTIEVEDHDQQPLSGATFGVHSIENSGLIQSGQTDENGIFDLHVHPGKYEIRIDHIQQKPFVTVIEVQSDAAFKFSLKSIDYIQLQLNWIDASLKRPGKLFLFGLDQINPPVSMDVVEEESIRLPLRSEGPQLIIFQSETVAEDGGIPTSGEYMGLLEVDKRDSNQFVLNISKAASPTLVMGKTKQKNGRVLMYKKWGKRLIPVGHGQWSADLPHSGVVRFPGKGTYKPLLIYEGNRSERTPERACWGDELVVDPVLEKILISPDFSTEHPFFSPYGYPAD